MAIIKALFVIHDLDLFCRKNFMPLLVFGTRALCVYMLNRSSQPASQFLHVGRPSSH